MESIDRHANTYSSQNYKYPHMHYPSNGSNRKMSQSGTLGSNHTTHRETTPTRKSPRTSPLRGTRDTIRTQENPNSDIDPLTYDNTIKNSYHHASPYYANVEAKGTGNTVIHGQDVTRTMDSINTFKSTESKLSFVDDSQDSLIISVQHPFSTVQGRVCSLAVGPNLIYMGTVSGQVLLAKRADGQFLPDREWFQSNTPIEGVMFDFEGKVIYATEFNLVILDQNLKVKLKDIKSSEPLRE